MEIIIANHIFDVVDHAVNGLEGKNVNMIPSPFLVGMVVDITLHPTGMFLHCAFGQHHTMTHTIH